MSQKVNVLGKFITAVAVPVGIRDTHDDLNEQREGSMKEDRTHLSERKCLHFRRPRTSVRSYLAHSAMMIHFGSLEVVLAEIRSRTSDSGDIQCLTGDACDVRGRTSGPNKLIVLLRCHEAGI